VDKFLFVIIQLFRYLLWLRRYKRKWSKSAFFKGVGHFERKFQTEAASPTNQCWCQKTILIALSCGIKISAVFGFVTKHACDRQTDGRTELRLRRPR